MNFGFSQIRLATRLLIGLAMLAFLPPYASRGQNATSNMGAIIDLQGTVEVLRPGGTGWLPATKNEPLRVGDQVRTGPRSRATIRLSNLTELRVSERMRYEIQAPRTAGEKPTIDVRAGSAYFFSRDRPQEFRINTPVVTGAIRGTEFNVKVAADGQTELALIDGAVELTNEQGGAFLTNGEQAVTSPGRAPEKSAILNTVNILQWNLYYPGILDPAELALDSPEERALAESLSAYRSGDLPNALKSYPAGRTPTSAMDRVYLAELLLAVGLVEEAEVELERVPTEAERAQRLAGALRQLVAAVKHTDSHNSRTPEFASEWLAESYYRQSRADLPGALAAARETVKKSPAFGFGWARLAELEFSYGHTSAAMEALSRSLELAPRNAQAVALKGFILAAQNRVPAAEAAFDEAIALDGALGNAWLGRGLCRIKRGHGESGREDLEIAAALEPNRSLLRSYLGKAFSNVGDIKRADKELRLALGLDENDPTPWLYLALLDYQEDRMGQSISEMEKSLMLNTNRQVFRSKLLLDEDRAVGSASLAKIYQNAGLEEVGVQEAARAVSYDYANYSAHLFLADSLNALRDPTKFNLRYETAWFNELLLANLLAPVGARTISQNVSQQEYSRLLEEDRLGLDTTSEYRSDGQFHELASQYGAEGRTSYSLDLDYQHNDGIRPNNSLSSIDWYSQIKQQVGPNDALLLLAEYYNYHSGDNFQRYNYTAANELPYFHYDEYETPNIVGAWHHEWDPGIHTLLLAGRLENDSIFTNENNANYLFAPNPSQPGTYTYFFNPAFSQFSYESKFDIYTMELNQIFQEERHTTILGARYQTGAFTTQNTIVGPNNTDGLTQFFQNPAATANLHESFRRISLYGYHTWEIYSGLLLTAGLNYDQMTYPDNFLFYPINPGLAHRQQFSPKLALTWTPRPEVTFRTAFGRSLGGASYDEEYTLEPTQIGGFNQAFRSIISESVSGSLPGSHYQILGAAADLKFETRTFLTLQAQLLEENSDENYGVFYFAPGPPLSVVPGSTLEQLRYREPSISATLNQLLGNDWSIGVQYVHTFSRLNSSYPAVTAVQAPVSSLNGTQEAELDQANAYLLIEDSSGFFGRAEARWYLQNNSGYVPAEPRVDFFQVNLLTGYHFWHRRGEAAFGVLNVGGGDYSLNPLSVYNELPHSRVFFGRMRFNF